MVSQNNNTQFGAHATATGLLTPELLKRGDGNNAFAEALKRARPGSGKNKVVKKFAPPNFSQEALQNAGFDSPEVATQVNADREAAAKAEQVKLEHQARIARKQEIFEVFSQIGLKERDRIEKLQAELGGQLSPQAGKARPDVKIATMLPYVSVSMENRGGQGATSFIDHLRFSIQSLNLRYNARNSNSWRHVLNGKKVSGPGADIANARRGHKKTRAVHAEMDHLDLTSGE